MLDLLSRSNSTPAGAAAEWWSQARERVGRDGPSCIPELFPQLPRRLGREPLAAERIEDGEAIADLAAWRVCDAAAYELLARPGAPDALEVDLFWHGDLEERTMVLRALALLPVTDATVQLLGEAQRTNTMTHFEAAVCDSNLAGRALKHQDFGTDDYNRLVLKAAFSDLPLERLIGALDHGNAELSRMLQGLATEREAAGRAVWAGTNRLIACAPTEGTVARLIGHVEHGDDRHRLAAVEGIAQLGRADLIPFLRERSGREPRPEIQRALDRAVATLEN